MAESQKTIRFKIDVETDGDGKIKALGIGAKDLAEAVAFAAKQAKNAKSAFDKMGGYAVMFNGIASCVINLNSVLQSLSPAYQAQEQNERRRAQAMHCKMPILCSRSSP